MNTSTLIYFLFLGSYAFVTAFVFFSDPKRLANRLFLALSVALSGHALVELGYRSSRSLAEAEAAWRFDFFWPLVLGLLLALVLALTERDRLLRRPWVIAAIAAPTAIFTAIEASTGWITGAPLLRWWGWSYGQGTSGAVSTAAYAWILIVYVVSLAIVISALVRTEHAATRRQYRIFVMGLLIVIGGNVAEAGLYQFDVEVPPLLLPSITVLHFLFGWAVLRHKMFRLSPMSAAETIVTTMSDALLLVDDSGRIMSGNPAAAAMLGYRRDQLEGMRLADVLAVSEAIPDWLAGAADGDGEPFGEAGGERPIRYRETALRPRDGARIPVSIASTVLRDNRDRRLGSLVIARDMRERHRVDQELARYRDQLEDLVRVRTAELARSLAELERETVERERAEAARRGLEAQLMHAQKMEAVGRLAGGVAHDFNNVLFVIQAACEISLSSIRDGDPLRGDLEEIWKASKSGEELAKQLLAFSRKQPAAPRVVDLADEVEETRRMLSRLLGADVALTYAPPAEPLRVEIDRGHLSQILTNLAVNARDAMPGGGEIAITTAATALGPEASAANPEARPGEYCVIRVADTGHGMSEQLLPRIFEPFFTTKGRGKGTGIGLSTVYGIAKQNGGFVTVRSQVGTGTAFEVWLPRSHAPLTVDQPTVPAVERRGGETILVVEDDGPVRSLVTRLLARQGYRVVEARDAAEAMRFCDRPDERVDLVFTDIVIPGMNGRRLSGLLQAGRPGLRVMFMSGHPDEGASYGPPAPGEIFLQKPFSSEQLTAKIRQALDAWPPAFPVVGRGDRG
jgi:PAS domain S-box-containing protein